jgi:threonine dehydratase
MAYHGFDLGIPVTVVMPVIAPIMKVSRCRMYNAEIVIYGNNIAESKEYALQLAKERSLDYING